MNFLIEEIKAKKNPIIVLAIIISLVMMTTLVAATASVSAATAQYYEVKLGQDTIAYVSSQEEAQALIDGIKNYYVAAGAEVLAVSCEPALTTIPHTYKVNEPGEVPEMTQDVQPIIDHIIAGETVTKTYTVQDGDTLWDISGKLGVNIEALLDVNEDENKLILPGDELSYIEIQPLVQITTEQIVTSDQTVAYGTVTETNDDMYVDETEVKTAGVNGVDTVEEQIVTVNGTVSTRTELSRTTKTAPVDEVVITGTKEREGVSYTGSSYTASYSGPVASGDGNAIVGYACQFVGNPYVYGGTSLTNGADCSGFVYAVFNDCGVWMPRTGQEYMGYSVPYSEARPGDILVYYGHVSIYMGGGMEVHACNERIGIVTTGVGYVGPLVDVRRVVG